MPGSDAAETGGHASMCATFRSGCHQCGGAQFVGLRPQPWYVPTLFDGEAEETRLHFRAAAAGQEVTLTPEHPACVPGRHSGHRYGATVVRKAAGAAVLRWDVAGPRRPPAELRLPKEQAVREEWWDGGAHVVFGALRYDAACAHVLAALRDPGWDGRWRLSDDEKVELLHRIDRAGCVFGAAQPDGLLTLTEVNDFFNQKEQKEDVAGLPSAVHGITNDSLVRDAFRTFDADRNGLDRHEWDRFLDTLEVMHIRYLLRTAFQAGQSFWGRGQPWRRALADVPLSPRGLLSAAGSSRAAVDAEAEGLRAVRRRAHPLLQRGRDDDCESGCVPPGWWDDFVYYSANNHPIHGVLSHDPAHRLDTRERVLIELATIGFSFYTAGLHKEWVVEGSAPAAVFTDAIFFSFAVVTVPGMLWFKVLFMLFTCPYCGFVNRARADRAEIERAARMTLIGQYIGFALVAAGALSLSCYVFAGIFAHNDGAFLREDLSGVLKARMQGYVTGWVLQLVLTFNPVLAWGQTDPEGPCCVGDWIGLGAWRIQKQQFQGRCLDACNGIVARRDVGGRSPRRGAAAAAAAAATAAATAPPPLPPPVAAAPESVEI